VAGVAGESRGRELGGGVAESGRSTVGLWRRRQNATDLRAEAGGTRGEGEGEGRGKEVYWAENGVTPSHPSSCRATFSFSPPT